MSVYTVLRLKCDGCQRNLVDVRRNMNAATSNGLQILVTARPEVELADFLPDDSLGFSYTIRCRCGRQHDRREDKLREYWRLHAARPSARVVYATMGRDV